MNSIQNALLKPNYERDYSTAMVELYLDDFCDPFGCGAEFGQIAQTAPSRGAGGWVRLSTGAEWVEGHGSGVVVRTATPISYEKSGGLAELPYLSDLDFEARGASPSRQVSVTPQWAGWRPSSEPDELSYSASAWLTPFLNYDISVVVADVNGNGVSGSTHLKSLVQKLVEAVLGALVAFVEAVKELASKVFEWIWDQITAMLDTVLKPITDAIDRWTAKIVGIFEESFTAASPITAIGDVVKAANNLFDFIATPITILTTIVVVLDAITVLSKAFTAGVSSLAGTLANYAVPIILLALGTGCIITGVLTLVVNPLEEALKITGKWGDAYARTSALITFFATLGIALKLKKDYWSAAAKALVAIFLISVSSDIWYRQGVIDIFILWLAFDAIDDVLTGIDEQARRVLSELVYVFSKASAITALIGGTLKIEADILQGKLTPS